MPGKPRRVGQMSRLSGLSALPDFLGQRGQTRAKTAHRRVAANKDDCDPDGQMREMPAARRWVRFLWAGRSPLGGPAIVTLLRNDGRREGYPESDCRGSPAAALFECSGPPRILIADGRMSDNRAQTEFERALPEAARIRIEAAVAEGVAIDAAMAAYQRLVAEHPQQVATLDGLRQLLARAREASLAIDNFAGLAFEDMKADTTLASSCAAIRSHGQAMMARVRWALVMNLWRVCTALHELGSMNPCKDNAPQGGGEQK